jgi:hypothetical protein
VNLPHDLLADCRVAHFLSTYVIDRIAGFQHPDRNRRLISPSLDEGGSHFRGEGGNFLGKANGPGWSIGVGDVLAIVELDLTGPAHGSTVFGPGAAGRMSGFPSGRPETDGPKSTISVIDWASLIFPLPRCL